MCRSILFALLIVCPSIIALRAADTRPNFVVINIDDLGYADIGPYGGNIPTPNLDRMAREGRLLTSHYGAPVCSPSRAALMTGCYPKRVLPIPHVLFPVGAVGLSPDELTVADVLKNAGYATACVGKWHLGDQPEFLPTRQGFDSYFGLPYSNDMGPVADGAKSNPGQPLPKSGAGKPPVSDESGLRVDQPPLVLLDGEKVVERVRADQQFELTRRYTDRAVSFIREQRERPFFLYFPHTAVHFPHYPAKEHQGKSPNGLVGDWVMEVDASVGRVLDTLRELGLSERTLVIFTSDNGGPLGYKANNGPLRGGKGQTFEGGLRVCTIAWWPGKIPAGTSTAAITTMMDVLPTFALLAGTKLQIQKIDGVSIQSVLTGDAQSPGPREVFHYFRGLKLEAIRRGPWKLHLGSGELYNLADDIGEKKNVADQNAEIVSQLRALAAEMDKDLGQDGIGPGVRKLGRVEKPQPLMDEAGKVRAGF